MDVCAARTLNEVQQEIGNLESAGIVVREFSVMGYSLGGCESLVQLDGVVGMISYIGFYS